MPSILFVCMANRFRSPLAAAFFRQCLEKKGMADSWQVSSAGMWAEPGLPVPEMVQDIARHFGIDLSDHRSRRVDRQLLAEHDLVLVMQASQQEALLTEFPDFEGSIQELSWVAECRTYDIPDLSASGEDVEEIAVELDDLVRCGFESICELAASLYNSRYGTKTTL
jgi:protein-tyrosine-phosphatase